jgi:hypothetical protein
MTISLSQASFFGIIFESFFYAAFLLVFAISIFLQWETRQLNMAFGNKLVFGFTILLFCFITTVRLELRDPSKFNNLFYSTGCCISGRIMIFLSAPISVTPDHT